MAATTLDQLAINQIALITKLNTTNANYRNKLLAMGITPGCKVSIVRAAPLGDPIQITIRGFQLCLRKTEAASIQVELED
jgi:ferrous iron transport protein A